MRRIQFRAWLPIVFGLISVALMAWRLHTRAWECDVYDEARINWHCEGSDFLLELINAPAIAFVRPLANLWLTRPWFFAYLVEFPFILFWWWLIGTRLDFGLLGVGLFRRRRAWIGLFIALFLSLITGFVWSFWESFRARSIAANAFLATIEDLRSLPLRLWLLILTSAFGLAAVHLARGRTTQAVRKVTSPRMIGLICLGLGLYSVGAAWGVWHFKLVEKQRQVEYDLHRIIIRGRVLDNTGTPVFAIKVDLVPVLDADAVPDEEAASDFTNENGEYELSPDQAGRYMLSVQWNAPPSTKHPFLTRYYPDTADPKQAETLEITPARHLTLNPIRLQRLALVRVPVSVYWSNGQAEPDAYLFFRNTRYPKYGAIGNETLNPDSDGTVSIPVGFEYLANAQVNCDEGQKIGNSYTPELALPLKSADASPKPLRFVLPGKPCLVWHPK